MLCRFDDGCCDMRSRRGPLRWFSPVVLILNDSAFILMLRYTKTTDAPRYINSTAVATSFSLSVVLTLLVLLCGLGPIGTGRVLWRGVVQQPMEVAKLCVPSVLWVVQSNLMFVAIDNLDAVVYLLLKQLKIMTTALFAVLMLGQRLRPQQWLALLMLTMGVGIVQMSNTKPPTHAPGNELENPTIGLLAVFGTVVISGFAGVYFERVLKKAHGGTAPSAFAVDGMWVRNVQLYVSTIPVAYVSSWSQDGAVIREGGFLQGYTAIVWGVVLLQAVGGQLNALIVNYTDNIVKMFAGSYVIIVSLLAEVWLFNFKPSLTFGAGAVLVNFASVVYGMYSNSQKATATQSASAVKPTAAADAAGAMETGSEPTDTMRQSLLQEATAREAAMAASIDLHNNSNNNDSHYHQRQNLNGTGDEPV